MITNLLDNKVYIGQSHSIEGRWAQHRSKSTSLHLRNAIARDGLENFKFEILEQTASDQSVLNDREIYWISKMNSCDPSKGYNKMSGGSFGKHSEETKRQMSLDKKAKYQGEGNPFYGKKHSDETKKLISKNNAFHRPEIRQAAIDALKGKPWPEARRRAHEAKKALKGENK
jgi:group I intron endonuclease